MTEKKTLDLGVTIDQDLITENVTRLVAASIAQALGDKERLVNNAVSNILSQYVDRSDGKPVRRGDYRAVPWLNYIAEKVVCDSVRNQMEQLINDNAEEFKAALKKELSKPKTRELFAERFVTAMLNSAERTWNMPITVQFEEPKSYNG